MLRHMVDKQVLKVYKDLSVEFNLPIEVIQTIVESQFDTATQAIKEGIKGQPDTFKNVMFLHLGKLVAKPGRVKFLQQKSDDMRKKRIDEEYQNNNNDDKAGNVQGVVRGEETTNR